MTDTQAGLLPSDCKLPHNCGAPYCQCRPSPPADAVEKCIFCGTKVGKRGVSDESSGDVACKDCGDAENQAQKREAVLSALKGYSQADEDGVMCLVSRQAVEEAIVLLQASGAAVQVPEGWPTREMEIAGYDVIDRAKNSLAGWDDLSPAEVFMAMWEKRNV